MGLQFERVSGWKAGFSPPLGSIEGLALSLPSSWYTSRYLRRVPDTGRLPDKDWITIRNCRPCGMKVALWAGGFCRWAGGYCKWAVCAYKHGLDSSVALNNLVLSYSWCWSLESDAPALQTSVVICSMPTQAAVETLLRLKLRTARAKVVSWKRDQKPERQTSGSNEGNRAASSPRCCCMALL